MYSVPYKKKSKKNKKRILVSSDGHGRFKEFMKSIRKSKFNPEKDFLIYLGDSIDKGKESSEFIRTLMNWNRKGFCEVLMGNHERMLLDVLDGHYPIENYIYNGGYSTLKSFNIELYSNESTMDTIKKKIGQDLIQWLRRRPLYLVRDGHIFVHAGIKSDVKIEEQSEKDLLWIRKNFYNKYKGERPVVFGHTPVNNLHNSFNVWKGNNCIGVDTGAGGGKGYVTVYDLKGDRAFQTRVWNS